MTRFRNLTAAFLRSDSGAVATDWIVLTAAMCGIGLAVVTMVNGGIEDLSGDIEVELASRELGTDFSNRVNFDNANGGAAADAFQRNQWDARTGDVAALETWMGGFGDQALLTHLETQAQYANTAQTGHPYDTYHDEFWVARDEAITRGLVPETAELAATH